PDLVAFARPGDPAGARQVPADPEPGIRAHADQRQARPRRLQPARALPDDGAPAWLRDQPGDREGHLSAEDLGRPLPDRAEAQARQPLDDSRQPGPLGADPEEVRPARAAGGRGAQPARAADPPLAAGGQPMSNA